MLRCYAYLRRETLHKYVVHETLYRGASHYHSLYRINIRYVSSDNYSVSDCNRSSVDLCFNIWIDNDALSQTTADCNG
jgi:hypothetical protein